MQWKSIILFTLALATGIAIGTLISTRDHKPAAPTPAEAGAVPEATKADWCFEHHVPESECTHCNPELVTRFQAAGDWCAEHGLPESHCRLCNPQLVFASEPAPVAAEPKVADVSVFFPANRSLCATDGALIQFASAQTADRAGLTVQSVTEIPSAATVEAPAEVVFDQTTTNVVTSTLSVSVIRWEVDPGQSVRADQAIALVESPQMAALQGEYLDHEADWNLRQAEQHRAEELFARGLNDAAARDLAVASTRAAAAHLTAAAGQLRAAGLSESDLEDLRTQHLITARYALRAPKDGILIERPAPLGVVLSPGSTLAVVGAPNAIWIEARVPDCDLRQVSAGQSAQFTTDGNAMDRVDGSVIWVSQFLDPMTRTATVRMKPTGSDDRLRAHAYGRMTIELAAESSVVQVPKSAVQWEGCCNVVFVRESPERFRPRKVRIEKGDTDHYRAIDGLKAGESIVVEGSYLLKTELKKGSIGAGCCAAEPAS